MAYSPDGIHWRIDPGPTWHPGVRADTGNQILYNPFTERYQVMTRASSVDRRIAMIESADLKTWSDPRVLLHPGPDDPVGMEFYGMPVCPYEDIFLGLLWKFQTGTTTAKSTSWDFCGNFKRERPSRERLAETTESSNRNWLIPMTA